jgi:rfaE bifunctional protein nucleotidyltransferase chain/domain
MALFPHAACLQMDIVPGDIGANLDRFKTLLDSRILPADSLVVLPELWATGFAYDRVGELARQTAVIHSELQKSAARHSLWFAGSLLEQQKDGAPCNTLFLVGPAGVAGSYRKHHLFSLWQEDQFLQAGQDIQPLETPFEPLGALVCYDLRFPEISRAQAFSGSRLIVLSAQWPAVRLDHWKLLVRARAVENQCYVAACNGCGLVAKEELAGHSMIVDPSGRILCEAHDEPVVIDACLDEAAVTALRARFCPAGERPWSGRDSRKVVSLEQLLPQLSALRNQGSRVVFTNGCFDLLHAGHVSYLERARCCGDCLVVALNSDRSVRALKGEGRPVNSEQERARVLAALGCVDYVLIFDEDTPGKVICSLLPDVLVKGADWPEDQIVGAPEVKAAGGRVERIVFEHQASTTRVIRKIQQQDAVDTSGE